MDFHWVTRISEPFEQVLHIRYWLPIFKGVTQDMQISTSGVHRSERRVIMSRIARVPGVQTVSFNGYRTTIQRGRAFSWEEVHAPIEKLLREHFEPDAEEPEIERQPRKVTIRGGDTSNTDCHVDPWEDDI